MVAKKNIQTIINVSTKYDAQQREVIGRNIVERIRVRTKSGISKDGNAFPSYTPEYAAEKGSGQVNLTATDDMLTELDVVSTAPGKIVVGYPNGHEDAGRVEGNQIGSYGQPKGNPSKARPFIGITQQEKDLIIAQAEQSFGSDDEKKSNLLDSFVNNLIRGQGES